jgi:hypothetical protein
VHSQLTAIERIAVELERAVNVSLAGYVGEAVPAALAILIADNLHGSNIDKAFKESKQLAFVG